MSREDLQHWLRLQQAWCDLRNAQAIGWREVWRRTWVWPRILRSAPTRTGQPDPEAPFEVQVICHSGDWLSAVWMLKSLFRVAGSSFPVVLHCQNPLKPSALGHLRRLFPDARIIEPPAATALVGTHLIDHRLPRCLHWRHQSRILQKLLDIHITATARRLVCLDTDVLFFHRPDRLLPGAPGTPGEYLFHQDEIDGYTAPREDLCRATGVELLPRLNSGIVSRPRDGIDLQQVEGWLALPEVARPSGHIEQTLQALSACSRGQAAVLPPEYCLDLQRRRDLTGLVCRHYAGPSRRWFTVEGIAALLRSGLA